jgi:hypothetical protein
VGTPRLDVRHRTAIRKRATDPGPLFEQLDREVAPAHHPHEFLHWRQSRRNRHLCQPKSTTRREFVKDATLGVAGISILSSLGARTGSSAQETRHGHLVKKITYRKDGWKTVGPGNNDYIWWPKGKDLENKPVNFAYGFYSQTGDWVAKPHKHASDQFLVFVGIDASKPQYLGAQIDYYNGEDSRSGQQQEMVAFDVPMCVACLAGQLHAPLITKRVDKTYAFFLIRRDLGARTNPNKTSKGYPIT